MDTDKDGLVSYEEFIQETKDSDFEKDEEWKPLTEEDQFTDEEYKEYERLLAEENVGWYLFFGLISLTIWYSFLAAR